MGLSIKGIIFDCDGTLIDSELPHFLAWKTVLQEEGITIPHEEIIKFSGQGDLAIALLLQQEFNLDPQLILEKKHASFEKDFRNQLLPISPNLNFFLDVVKHKAELGLKIGLASGGSRKDILHALNVLKIKEKFDVILSGVDDITHYKDHEGINKPKPYVYLEIAKLLNLSPSQCLAIEDSETGVKAATSAGIFTVAVPTKYSKKQNLSLANLLLPSLEGWDIKKLIHHVERL